MHSAYPSDEIISQQMRLPVRHANGKICPHPIDMRALADRPPHVKMFEPAYTCGCSMVGDTSKFSREGMKYARAAEFEAQQYEQWLRAYKQDRKVRKYYKRHNLKGGQLRQQYTLPVYHKSDGSVCPFPYDLRTNKGHAEWLSRAGPCYNPEFPDWCCGCGAKKEEIKRVFEDDYKAKRKYKDSATLDMQRYMINANHWRIEYEEMHRKQKQAKKK